MTLPRWNISDLADAFAAGLAREGERLDVEHAVLGIDALDELELHPILAACLGGAGYGVHREQRYPADRHKTWESEGERCDLVLTPDDRPLRGPDHLPTLFDEPDALGLDDAFWLEVKVVAQFVEDGANTSYTAQLLSTTRGDIRKLSKDPGILHAGLLIVLFVRDRETADHDLGVWLEHALRRGLPVSAPSIRFIPINDRRGNATCALALVPVWHL